MQEFSDNIIKILKISQIKYKIFFFLGLIILSSLLDILNLALVIPIINIIFNKDNFATNPESFIFKDFIFNLSDHQILIAFLIAFFLKSFFTIFIYHQIVKLKLNLQASLRYDLIKKYQSIDYKLFLEKPSSNYIYNMTSVITQYSNGLMSFLRLIVEVFIVTAIFIYIMVLNGIKILFIASILILVLFFYNVFLKKKILVIAKKINHDSKNIIQLVKDVIIGFKDIKIAKKEDYFNIKIKDKTTSVAKNSTIYEVILFSPRHIFEFLFIFIFIIFLSYNIDNVQNNQLQFSYLAGTLIYASLRIIPSISTISQLISILNKTSDATNILYEDLFLKKYSIEKNYTSEYDHNWKFENIVLKNLNFKFAQNKIFENVNLTINAGDNILILGKSGSGKSTLLDLVFGFYKPDNGDILINGSTKNYNNLKQISFYVSQNRFLFDDTIFNNIVMDENIKSIKDLDESKKKSLYKALEITNLKDILDYKTEGWNFKIGEDGKKISGGQRQRISLARLIYSNSYLNILDEATSELDKDTEQKIFKNIFKSKEKTKTYVVISHNENLKDLFNKVYKLQDRKFIEYI